MTEVRLVSYAAVLADLATLLARLTALRADYLEELGPTNIPSDIDDLTTNLATANASIVVLDTLIEAIKAVTDALGILEETGGTFTTDGNEQIVYVNETPAGVFRPVCVKINVTNHTAAETIVIREYYREASGGAYLREDTLTFAGAITEESITVDLDPNRFGVKLTLQLTAGSNYSLTWEVYYKV